MHAKRSFEEGKAIARSLSMEILVYVSGQRQCSLASKFGLHEGENSVYVLVLDGDEVKAADLVKEIVKECEPFSPNEEKLKAEFGITDAEIEAAGENRVEELVIERVALVDAWK
jgi:KEOPS complex subunit Cgi121